MASVDEAVAPELLSPDAHVLSTLERDGSRRWLKPKLSRGRLWQARRMVAYALIAVYAVLPHLRVGGRPLFLLDIAARRFTIAGYTFLPTDTLLLALFLVAALLTVFLATALVGRVWCGWACPHTVYMEFLFRPLERLFDGVCGRGGHPRRPPATWRSVLKYGVFFVVSLHLSNTLLAYFVGAEAVSEWVLNSPTAHPGGFMLVAVVTGAMMVHFGYFREQLCILACPYGRLQSALLDDHSRIVAYDAKRGEPRGRGRSLPVVGQRGDCVDCKLCVQTCPTGIDIRDGLQMECVNCTQCIDACNAVMRKVGRAPNLIRYSSQANDAGSSSRILRPRTVIYPLILLALGSLLGFLLATKSNFDAVLLRNAGQPYMRVDEGVRNVLNVKLTNRDAQPQRLRVEQAADGPAPAAVVDPVSAWVEPGETRVVTVLAVAPETAFVRNRGQLDLALLVRNERGAQRTINAQLLGPESPLRKHPTQ